MQRAFIVIIIAALKFVDETDADYRRSLFLQGNKQFLLRLKDSASGRGLPKNGKPASRWRMNAGCHAGNAEKNNLYLLRQFLQFLQEQHL